MSRAPRPKHKQPSERSGATPYRGFQASSGSKRNFLGASHLINQHIDLLGQRFLNRHKAKKQKKHRYTMASILCCTSGNQTVEAVVQPAWDNHFAAFGGQDVSKVLLDYCEESKIIVYNWHDDTETVYNGMAGDCVEIKQCVGCTRQVFTKSFPGDDAAVLARSSGEERASPRHRAGVASIAWRTTR